MVGAKLLKTIVQFFTLCVDPASPSQQNLPDTAGTGNLESAGIDAA